MLWGRMPRAVRSSAEEIQCHISIKIKKKKIALKEAELQHTAAMTSLICLEESAKTHFASCCKFHFWFDLGNDSVKVTETTGVQTPIPPSPALSKVQSNDDLPRVAFQTHPSTWQLRGFHVWCLLPGLRGFRFFSVGSAVFRTKLPSPSVSGYRCCCSTKPPPVF